MLCNLSVLFAPAAVGRITGKAYGCMNDTEFKAAIADNSLRGGYLLYGEEDFLKLRYGADMCRAVCGEDEEFDCVRIDAAAVKPSALDELLATYPFMAERRAVLLSGFRPGELRESELCDYIRVFSRMEEYTHAVLAVSVPSDGMDRGTAKKPSAQLKRLSAVLTPVEFQRKTPGTLRKWIIGKLASVDRERIRIREGVADALLSSCGSDMNILSGECEKLAAYALATNGGEVCAEMVREVCCVYETEDAFALANAVLDGNRKAALRALKNCRDRREEPVAVCAALARVLSDMLHVSVLLSEGADRSAIAAATKMHEYKCSLYMNALTAVEPGRLRATVERCLKCDRELKSSSPGYAPLERFICTIPKRR